MCSFASKSVVNCHWNAFLRHPSMETGHYKPMDPRKAVKPSPKPQPIYILWPLARELPAGGPRKAASQGTTFPPYGFHAARYYRSIRPVAASRGAGTRQLCTPRDLSPRPNAESQSLSTWPRVYSGPLPGSSQWEARAKPQARAPLSHRPRFLTPQSMVVTAQPSRSLTRSRIPRALPLPRPKPWAQPLDPILVPRLRIHFADCPYLL